MLVLTTTSSTSAPVSIARRAVRPIAEAEVRRDCDRQQDADDHDDDEQLDQREAFLTLEPLPQLAHLFLLWVVYKLAAGSRVTGPASLPVLRNHATRRSRSETVVLTSK